MLLLPPRNLKSEFSIFADDEKNGYKLEPMLENGSSPDVVAKVVLNAVTSENPSPKYLAGKDIETWMEAKTRMSDEEFHNNDEAKFHEVEHREKKKKRETFVVD